MSDCSRIDSFVTPFVDGELPETERRQLEEHVAVCSVCRTRVRRERVVRGLLTGHRGALCSMTAPATLRDRITARMPSAPVAPPARTAPPRSAARDWRTRALPMALAAMLVIVLAGAVGYRMTQSPVRLLAAELTADHVMCFIFHGDPDRAPTRGEVEQALERQFGWNAALPSESQEAGLELVGVRPCLSADGRVAHIMYRYEGRPVSVYMVPDLARAAGLFDVLGHRAMAWTFEGRTYVLVASEPPAEMARIARLMYAGLR